MSHDNRQTVPVVRKAMRHDHRRILFNQLRGRFVQTFVAVTFLFFLGMSVTYLPSTTPLFHNLMDYTTPLGFLIMGVSLGMFVGHADVLSSLRWYFED